MKVSELSGGHNTVQDITKIVQPYIDKLPPTPPNVSHTPMYMAHMYFVYYVGQLQETVTVSISHPSLLFDYYNMW